MVRKLFCLFLICGGLWGSAGGWPHEGSDLTPDSDIHFGKLDNGLRYLIQENRELPGRASMRIVFQVGSLLEEDGQEGMAHFLEHMAFNGTERFPEGEMIEYLQRLGMAFGPDTNANTGFDRTLYKLDFPTNDTEILKTGLMLLRDYADKLLLEPAEVEQERGIILAEKQARDSVGYRIREAEMAFILEGLKYPERLPIGTEEAIRAMTAEEFRGFYERWYRPDRTILVVVGDFEGETLKGLVEEAFEDWEALPVVQVMPDFGQVVEVSEPRAAHHTEAEAAFSDVVIYGVRAFEKGPDTIASRSRNLLEQIGHAVVGRRFEEKAREPDSVFNLGYSWSTDYYEGARIVALGVQADPQVWEPSLVVAEQELRRVLEHGFTEAEVAEAVATVLSRYEQKTREAGTRRSRQLADLYANQSNGGFVLLSPEQEQRLAEEVLGGVTAEKVSEVYRSLWMGLQPKIWVGSAFEFPEGRAEELILATYTGAAAVPVEALERELVGEFPYGMAEEAGQIIEEEEVEDLGVSRIRFANGLVVHLRPSDFEKNRVQIEARFGKGLDTLPVDRPGLQRLASAVWIDGGLGKVGKVELDRMLAGRQVSINFSVEDNAFLLRGSSNREDLPLQLRLLGAYLTDPGYRDESLAIFRRGIPGLYQALGSTWQGAVDRKVKPWLRGGDHRFVVPEQAEMALYSLEDLREWIGRPIDLDGLEVNLVGDFDRTEVLEHLTRTLGAVERESDAVPSVYWEVMPKPAAGGERRLVTFPSAVRQGVLLMTWPSGGLEPVENSRTLGLLANVLDDRIRVKVRETLGDTYSYSVYNNAARNHDQGQFTVLIQTDPARMEVIEAVVLRIVDELVREGISDDEMTRARLPILKQVEAMQRNNGYWLRVLGEASRRPEQLDWARSLENHFETIDRRAVEEAGRRLFEGHQPAIAWVFNEAPDER